MLFQLKAEGLATSVGLAMGRLDIMLPLVKAWPFDVVLSHNRYSLLNRSADALFDYARSKDMTVINAAPYAGGVLAKGSAQVSKITYQDVDAAKLEPVRRIEQICAAHSIAPGAAALQFSMHDPRIASTVVGVSRAERVAQTLRWADQAISAETWAELRALAYETTDPEAERVYRPG
jgi:D-threo-aldose 1-dehydrogenase